MLSGKTDAVKRETEAKRMYVESQVKVKVKRNTNGDTRVATHIPTVDEFDDANRDHRKDVRELVARFCALLAKSAERHDYTKVKEPYRSMFYRDMVATMEGRLTFEEGEWARLHYEQLERHHLLRHVPEDVDLFDVIEMVCDCVAAGMARSGEVRPLELQEGVLRKAVDNTVRILQQEIEIEEGE